MPYIVFLKKEKVAIVHSHTPKAGIVAMLAAKLAGVEHRLHTVAGLPLMEASGFKRVILIAVERLTYRCATMVYPNSKGLNDFIIKEELSRPEKLKILGQGSSNGIDTQFFKPDLFSEAQNAQLKEKLGIGSSDFIFVFVGRLVADKGINELVTAFNEVHQKHPHSALVMVGPFEETLDPLQPETLSIIENHSAIHCVGYQDDVRPYYAFAKALTFPSYREGFPNVVMQAGAMGLPSIVSDINGCNEIVKEAINGLIVKPKDALSLKNAMMRLLEDPDLFTNLKDSSRAAITSLYERSIMHNAILKEYKSIM